MAIISVEFLKFDVDIIIKSLLFHDLPVRNGSLLAFARIFHLHLSLQMQLPGLLFRNTMELQETFMILIFLNCCNQCLPILTFQSSLWGPEDQKARKNVMSKISLSENLKFVDLNYMHVILKMVATLMTLLGDTCDVSYDAKDLMVLVGVKITPFQTVLHVKYAFVYMIFPDAYMHKFSMYL